MIENDSTNGQKSTEKFVCESCDYSTSRKSHYMRHLSTDKHKNTENDSKMVVFDSDSDIEVPKKKYSCACGRSYSYDSGYYRHKKTCTYVPPSNTSMSEKHLDLIIELVKDNKEIKDFLLEQNKQIIELAKLAGHNTTTNSHNKVKNKFNINVFLNEKCKDALNISDFVEQLEISIKDLEETGRLGFAEGISKIFINGLNQLEIYDRPIHCNDYKREVMYIKESDKWTKENDFKPILTKAIKDVAHKNMKQITEWQKLHVDYNNPKSKQNDKYLKIVMEAMSGSTKEESENNYNKIIKNIAKKTIIPESEK